MPCLTNEIPPDKPHDLLSLRPVIQGLFGGGFFKSPALVQPEWKGREACQQIRLELVADPVRVELGQPDHGQEQVLVKGQGLKNKANYNSVFC